MIAEMFVPICSPGKTTRCRPKFGQRERNARLHIQNEGADNAAPCMFNVLTIQLVTVRSP